jgi:hypothetical protein
MESRLVWRVPSEHRRLQDEITNIEDASNELVLVDDDEPVKYMVPGPAFRAARGRATRAANTHASTTYTACAHKRARTHTGMNHARSDTRRPCIRAALPDCRTSHALPRARSCMYVLGRSASCTSILPKTRRTQGSCKRWRKSKPKARSSRYGDAGQLGCNMITHGATHRLSMLT